MIAGPVDSGSASVRPEEEPQAGKVATFNLDAIPDDALLAVNPDDANKPKQAWEEPEVLSELPQDKDLIMKRVRDVVMCPQQLLQRLLLEVLIRNSVLRLLVFIVYIVPFFCTLTFYAPPDQMSQVHERLVSVFRMSPQNLEGVTKISDIYSFLSTFMAQNSKLLAASGDYWCQEADYVTSWDLELGLPSSVCSSSPRRLDQEDTTMTDDAAFDQEAELGQTEERILQQNYRTLVRHKKFVGPQTTMIAPIIHQRRFAVRDCKEFATDYQNQMINPDNFYSPALDGTRAGPLLLCPDRDTELKDEFAINQENCTVCPDEMFNFSRKLNRDGKTLYPMLLESSTTIQKLQEVQWLDAQTDVVTVSTLAYTEGLEIFTGVTIEFQFDEVGSIKPKIKLLSRKELIGSDRGWFLGSAIVAIVFGMFAIGIRLLNLLDPTGVNPVSCFELLSQFAVTVVCSALVVSWLSEIDIHPSYEDTLYKNRVASWNKATTAQDLWESQYERPLIEEYLNTIARFDGHSARTDALFVFGYVVIAMQIVQLFMYLHVHPRIAVMNMALVRAMKAVSHCAAAMVAIYFTFAFAAHWLFGQQLDAFRTYGRALIQQLRMIYGNTVYADGVDDLPSSLSTCYWLYVVAFSVVIFFYFVFVIIAHVMDQFREGQELLMQNPHEATTRSLFVEAIDCLFSPLRHMYFGWPKPTEMIEWLQDLTADEEGAGDVQVSFDEIHEKFGEVEEDQLPEHVRDYVYYYGLLVPGTFIIKGPAEKGSRTNTIDEAEMNIALQQVADQGEPLPPPTLPPPKRNRSKSSDIRPSADPARLGKFAVYQVTQQLASADLSKVDWIKMTSQLSCSFYKEFRASGLIN